MTRYFVYPLVGLLLAGAGVLIGAWLAAPPAESGPLGGPVAHAPETAPAEEAGVWSCSMHPEIRLPEAGACPICGMDLIYVDSAPAGDEGAAAVTLSPAAVRRAGLRTAAVEQRPVDLDVHMVGAVHYDDTRVARITAWLGGRIERMFVDYAGTRVNKGDHLFELYSPALLVAQQELLQSSREARRLKSVGSEIIRQSAEATLKAAKEKLLLWGLQGWQVRSILKRSKPLKTVTIYAPIGGTVTQKTALEGSYVETGTPIYTIADLHAVWVVLHAYESDVQWLRYGQSVEFEVAAYPGRAFSGTIAFIAPTLDARTRTVDVRLSVDNTELQLKPGMFVRAQVKARIGEPAGDDTAHRFAGQWVCPMHPEVIRDAKEKCGVCGMSLVPAEEHWLVGNLGRHLAGDVAPLVIPASAPLRTGRRSVVFVERPDTEEPSYELREVRLGPLAGDVYVVHEGLRLGERVVAEGAFKLDSALQIRGDRSLLTLESGAETGVEGEATTPEARLARVLREASARTAGGAVSMTPAELTAIEGAARDLRSFSLLVLGPVAWLEEAEEATARQAALSLVASMAARVEDIGDLSGLTVVEPERPEGFHAALAAVIAAARDVSVALAADDLEGASGLRPTLVEAAESLTELGGGAVDPALLRAAQALREGGDTIDELRARFANLNGAVIPLALAESAALDGRFQLAFCSMALDAGAFWLQAEGELANPYYGAQMLRCGESAGTFGGTEAAP